MRTTTAVLLAAGAGTRLGRGPKALLPFHGTSLVVHLGTELLAGGCREVVVVIGAGAEDVRDAGLPLQCRTVENTRWADGMGGSFALGVASVPEQDNVLVALVDQPGVTADLVARLLAAHRAGRITAAGYRPAAGVPGKLARGHPILFDSAHAIQAAGSATGDAGARLFLRSHAHLIDLVDCSDLSDGADVDTPAGLHLLER